MAAALLTWHVCSQVVSALLAVHWSTSVASGQLELTTNSSGMAVALLDLSALPPANQSSPGETLQLQAVWVGPTRETIRRSLSVVFRTSARRLALQTSVLTQRPGVQFGVTAELRSNEDDSLLAGRAPSTPLPPPTLSP